MTISIAMTTFNGERYIEEQLHSIVKQSILPDEVVIVDDCSSDKTKEIIDKFNNKLNIKFFKNDKRIGYSQNFSKALSLCTGEYIFLSDQDDYWLSSKIEKVVKVFEDDKKISLVMHDLLICDENLSNIGETKLKRMRFHTNINEKYITGMAMAVRKDFLELCLPIPGEVSAHDVWLSMCSNTIEGKIVISDLLALYRRHDSNTTINTNIINKGKKISFWELFWKDFSSPMADHIVSYLYDYRSLKEWLNGNSLSIESRKILSNEAVKIQLGKIDERIFFLEERAKLLSKPRIMRVLDGFRLYTQGGYRDFKGVFSMVKDIFVK